MTGTTGFTRVGDRLEQLAALDRVVDAAAGRVAAAVERAGLKGVLSGSWLGHPLHPLLTDLPIGSWTSAMLLDIVGGKRAQPAADLLVATGIVTALPTAAAGLSDWSELGRPEQRVGVVHAAANVVGLGLYCGSFAARRRGRRARGVILGFAAATALTAGGYLGGHLSYRRGAGVNRNAFDDGPTDWTVLAGATEPAEGAADVGRADDVAVVVARSGGRLCGLADRCSHQGGPLHEGEVVAGRIRCPWHASEFDLDDGTVVRGPATAPQPVYDVRSIAGGLEVRRHTGARSA
jgi:nitrite reductase/ring-hydroxylating ferredoxin subunit/uncharacterized membrane protein